MAKHKAVSREAATVKNPVPPVPGKTAGGEIDDATRQMLVSLNIAEYAALMQRCTNWFTLEFTLLPLLLLFVGFMSRLWQPDDIENHRLVFFSSGIGVHLLGIGWAQVLFEHYDTVRYVESNLYPSVKRLVKSEEFWDWEPYLAPRVGKFLLWTEGFPIAVLAALIILTLYYRPFQGAALRWWGGNVILLVVLFFGMNRARQTRRTYSEPERARRMHGRR